MRIKRSRKQAPAFIKIVITVVALAFTSLGAAFAWQNAENSLGVTDKPVSENESVILAGEVMRDDEPASETGMPYKPMASVSEADGERIKTASEAAADVAAKSGGQPGEEGGQPGAYAREAVTGAVAESASVGYDYFNDAIFFGDSISTGIPLYMKTMVPNTAVIASQGVSPEGAYSSKCIDVNNDGNRVTMLEAAKTKGPRGKIYIMLGGNALDLQGEQFINGYDTFLKAVKEMYPDAVIYVQSVLPVTASVNKVYKSPNINNQRISEYNEMIRDMTLKNGAYYVDVAQAIVDGDGFLPLEASPFDGMHLTSEYYIKWFDYLRAHTVEIHNK